MQMKQMQQRMVTSVLPSARRCVSRACAEQTRGVQQRQQTSGSKRTMQMQQMMRLGVRVTCECPMCCVRETQQEQAWSEQKKHPKGERVQTVEAESAGRVETTKLQSSRRQVWHQVSVQLLHALLLSAAVAVVPAGWSLMRR